MDRDTLRSIQRPLKDRYRAEPDAALVDVSGTVSAEGDLDFRGTLGLDASVPVGFTSIRLTFDLDTTASPEDVSKLIETTEKYCVVLQTITGGVAVTVTTT